MASYKHITSDVFCFDGSRKEMRFYVIVSVTVKIAVSWMCCPMVVAVAILGLCASEPEVRGSRFVRKAGICLPNRKRHNAEDSNLTYGLTLAEIKKCFQGCSKMQLHSYVYSL